MASLKTIETNTNKIEPIGRLWAMGGAKASKNHQTGDIDCYLCYCDECKNKSISKEGGIAFGTAEELLEHRKMEAFNCTCGCGYYVCKQYGSIMSHIKAFHEEVLKKLEKEGLDITKRQMIYPDYINNTYTLMKPMPQMDASPLENFGIILSMTPKRVQASPTQSLQQNDSGPMRRPNNKFVPTKFTAEKAKENKIEKIEKDEKIEKPLAFSTGKTWNVKKKDIVSLVEIMDKLKEETIKINDDNDDDDEQDVHYAQEDMFKEKQCRNEKCKSHKNPFACAFNHDGEDDVIPYGTQLTKKVLCPSERPPFRRCEDTFCSLVHLKGRVTFIMKKKTEYYNSAKNDDSYQKSDIKMEKTKKQVKKATQVEHFTDEDSDDEFEKLTTAIEKLEIKKDDIILMTISKEIEDEIDLSDLKVFAEKFNHIQNAVATA